MSTEGESVNVDQKIEKPKRPRTEKQIEATRKLVEANKLKREEKAKAKAESEKNQSQIKASWGDKTPRQ